MAVHQNEAVKVSEWFKKCSRYNGM